MAPKRTTKTRLKKHVKPAAKAKRATVRAVSSTSKKSTKTIAGDKRTTKKNPSRPTTAKAKATKATTRAANTATGKGRAARVVASLNHKKKAVAPRSRNSRSTAPATSQDPIQFPEEKPLPKTKMTAKQLREFKKLLLGKRAELMGDVRRLSDGALKSSGNGDGEHATMPIHMADVGSDNWEQEFTLGLVATEQAVVRQIDEALDRIVERTYGICVATRQPISEARLRAKPWAKYCIEHARAREEGRSV